MGKSRFTTGVIVGSIIGASASMLMDMDKKAVKRLKKRMNNMQSMLKM